MNLARKPTNLVSFIFKMVALILEMQNSCINLSEIKKRIAQLKIDLEIVQKLTNYLFIKNFLESGDKVSHIFIEPYEMLWLESIVVDDNTERVESSPMHLFKDMNVGDLSFLVSSPLFRPQHGVLHEYLMISPSLKSCVYVDVHYILRPLII